MRERIFEIVGAAKDGDYASRAYDLFVVFVALLSIVPLLFEYSSLTPFSRWLIDLLDIVTVYILIADYVFRWMTHDMKVNKGWRSFVQYPFTPMAIIDLLAILPSLGVIPQAFRFLRVLRVVKVFRYSRNLVVITNACAREAKTLLSVFIAVIVYMLTVALVVYTGEPEAFVNYFDAVCWAATQMTSVTFSDSRPVSYLGKALSIASALVALLVVALPAGVITGAYINEVRESRSSGSRYFKMTGRSRFNWKEMDSPLTWMRNNLKLFRYAFFIVILTIVTVLFMVVLNFCNFEGTVCIIGVALAAFLLEPAAGIMVGLLSCCLSAIVFSQIDFVLFLPEYILIALVFGLLLPRLGSRHFLLRVMLCVFILVFGLFALDTLVALARAHYSVGSMTDIQLREITLAGTFVSLGLPPLQGVLAGTLATYALDTCFSTVIFCVLVFGFGVRAAPSEAERHQQQAILLERALKRKQLDDENARELAQATLQNELGRLKERQQSIVEEIALIEDRLGELQKEEQRSVQGEDNQETLNCR